MQLLRCVCRAVKAGVVGWLVECLVGWLGVGLVVCLVSWLVGWLDGWVGVLYPVGVGSAFIFAAARRRHCFVDGIHDLDFAAVQRTSVCRRPPSLVLQ